MCKNTILDQFNPEEDAIFEMGDNITKSYINYIKKNKKYIQLAKKYNMSFDSIVRYINETLDCDMFSIDVEELNKRIEKLKNPVVYISINEQIAILGENLNAIVLEEKDHMSAKVNKYIASENNINSNTN